ncbi:MAG TPA: tetratricopeptide repeat protein [Hyphomicrobiaceae bacterium]|nr:tetratricopeptide repeat protein [Hyphomicrobiaceae bacterium]
MRIPCAAAIYALFVVVGMGLGIYPGAAQSDAEIDALNRRAAELYQAKNFEEAMAAAQQALALAEARFPANDPRLSKLLSNLALINEVLNRAAEAEPLYRRALAIDEAASGPDHIAVGRTLSRLAQFCARQKRYAEAEGFYQRSVSLLDGAAGADLGDVVGALNGLASIYRVQGRFNEAEAVYARALAASEKALGPDHIDVAAALDRLASVQEAQGRYPEAQSLYQRCLDITERARGPDHPELRKCLERLASGHERQRQYAEAEALYQRAIAITEKALGANDPDLRPWLEKLARAYQMAGRDRDAEPVIKRGLTITETALGPEHPDLRRWLDSLAANYDAQRRSGEAAPLLERALAIMEKALGPEHPDLREPLGKLASSYEQQQRLAEAEPLRRRQVALLEKARGPDDVRLRPALNSLAFLYKRQGRYREAEAIYQRILVLAEKEPGGPDNTYVRAARNDLIEIYTAEARTAEAEPLMRRELAAAEAKFAADPQGGLISRLGLHNALNQLGRLLRESNRPAEAEALFRRALANDEKLDDERVFSDLINLGWVLHDTNRLSEAEPLLRRALALAQNGPNHEQARALNSLGTLLASANRLAEAETLFRRALPLAEEFGYGPHIATTLSNLAGLLQETNRPTEAEALYRRALAIAEQSFGPEHPNVATPLNNLATLLQGRKRYTDAEPLFRRALAIGEKTLGPEHPKVALRLSNLAELLTATERRAEAEPLLRRALAIDEKSLGADHPRVATDLNSLAAVLKDTIGVEAAEPLVRRALAIDELGYGSDHPHVARDLHNLAVLRAQAGDWREAQLLLARATPVWIGPNGGAAASDRDAALKGALRQNSDALRFHAVALNRADPHAAGSRAAAFEIAQWALQSEAGEALAQMSARLAKGEGPLVDLVRRRQDLVGRRQIEDKRLLAGVGQADATTVTALRASMANIDQEVASIDAELDGKFPDYANFAHPKPLSIAGVQALLNADEALVLFLDTKQRARLEEQTLIWVISKTSASWHRSPLGTRALADSVLALRCGLDQALWNEADSAQKCVEMVGLPPEAAENAAPPGLPFDLARAHQLYTALLGPAQALIKGKHLLIVPSGPLLSLPFNVLVVEPPGKEPSAKPAAYRRAAWLGLRQPISILPSVASLAALRRHAGNSVAPDPFLGYGDPVLAGQPGCPEVVVPATCPDEEIRVAAATRGPARGGKTPATFASYFRDGQADVGEVRKLCPLPDTAHELACVAKSLGANQDAVVLGKDMTETVVKAAALSRYRVVHFATHGLLAGEAAHLGNGRAEPALVLSPPEQPTELDDGLLTASEVAGLKLDADWVVLSACNTAAAEEVGAEALSGLARAFFYAGARALLVSHWPVDSYAATLLTSRTFAELRRSGRVGRAEAFRRAMVALANDDRRPWTAHPSVWAPFAVVGAGVNTGPMPAAAPRQAAGKADKGRGASADDWQKRAFDP